MSFELFVQCIRNGEAAVIDRKVAEGIFDRGAFQPSNLQNVEYPDGFGEFCRAEEGEDCDGITLSRFGGTTICERVLKFAKATRSLIYWPSENILFAVTDRSTLQELPDEILGDGAKIALVKTVDQLWAAINAEEDDESGVELVWPTNEGSA